MDNDINIEHYKKTVRDAQDIDGDETAAKRREDALDAEIAYETMAVNCAMNTIGMEETTANLMQLALARNLLEHETEETGITDNDE